MHGYSSAFNDVLESTRCHEQQEEEKRRQRAGQLAVRSGEQCAAECYLASVLIVLEYKDVGRHESGGQREVKVRAATLAAFRPRHYYYPLVVSSLAARMASPSSSRFEELPASPSSSSTASFHSSDDPPLPPPSQAAPAASLTPVRDEEGADTDEDDPNDDSVWWTPSELRVGSSTARLNASRVG